MQCVQGGASTSPVQATTSRTRMVLKRPRAHDGLPALGEIEARLWRIFETTPPELCVATASITGQRVFELLDVSSYYRALGRHMPAERDEMLADLERKQFIQGTDAGSWDVTNVGALCVGIDLATFEGLARRSVRVIRYRGTTRTRDA